MRLKTNVAPLARIMAKSLRKIPYTNHKNTPVMKVSSMTKETSFADFVCHVLIICGRKALVVKVAADNPKTVSKSIRCNRFN